MIYTPCVYPTSRVRRCHDCHTPLEAEPDVSRDLGYPVWYCPTCADEAAGVEPDDEGDYEEGAVFDNELPGMWELADYTGGLDEVRP